MTLFQWEIWACFAATRCSYQGIIVVSDTRSVFLMSSLLRDFVLDAVNTVLHGPEARSSWTGSGPWPSDYWPLPYVIVEEVSFKT